MPNNQDPGAEDSAQTNQPVDQPAEPKPGAPPAASTPATKSNGKSSRWWRKFVSNKKLFIPTVVVAVLLLLLAIPATRYSVIGLAYKRSVAIQVLDSTSNQPVSEATVKFAGQSQVTDNQGNTVFAGVKPGNHPVEVTKQYYDTANADQFVGLSGGTTYSVSIKASGRPYSLLIQNRITKEPISDALVALSNFQARSDNDGKAQIVVPFNTTEVQVDLSKDGYNSSTVKVDLSSNKAKILSLTPAGTIYFLSDLSGKIDVIKSNLDGSHRQLVLAGTGNETSYSTTLIPSPDWQYLVLIARRSGKYDSVYLIKTSDDSLTTIDEGAASFRSIGWLGDTFIYNVDVNGKFTTLTKLKSYSPASAKLTLLDLTTVVSQDLYQYYAGTFILGDSLFFVKNYVEPYYAQVKRYDYVETVKPDGSDKTVLKQFDANKFYLSATQVKVNQVYVQASHSQNELIDYYSYSGGVLSGATLTDDQYDKSRPDYIVSPNGQETLWTEIRDGKNFIFVGDANGDNGKLIARLEDLQPYGWLTEDLLLYSKDNDQLYIGGRNNKEPVKVTDYHAANYGYSGYGGY